jgi:hypothetical protein
VGVTPLHKPFYIVEIRAQFATPCAQFATPCAQFATPLGLRCGMACHSVRVTLWHGVPLRCPRSPGSEFFPRVRSCRPPRRATKNERVHRSLAFASLALQIARNGPQGYALCPSLLSHKAFIALTQISTSGPISRNQINVSSPQKFPGSAGHPRQFVSSPPDLQILTRLTHELPATLQSVSSPPEVSRVWGTGGP